MVRITESDARGLDPQMVSDLASTRIAADQFEGLTRFNASGEAEAGLAQDWTVSADGLTWKFTLKPGLQFSDGVAISADVFQSALTRIRDEKAGSPHSALFAVIDTITAPDAHTVLVQLLNPFPQLPSLLAHPAIAALPFHRIKAKGEGWTADRPLVTSGAYQLQQWKLNEAVDLVANPRWHAGKPESARVIWKPMDNMQSAMRLVLAKGADTAGDFPANRLQWLKERYPQTLHASGYIATYYFAFNTRRPPFDDRRIRRALSMAVDRDWMADKMINAGNEPAWGLLPAGLGGDTPYQPEWASWPMPKRLQEARRLLAAAGYSPQHTLRFEIRFNSSAEHRRAAVAMATMWRPLGVEAALLNSESSLHFDSLKRADFAFARSGWIADLPAPENFLSVHKSDTGIQNYSGYASPEYDAALDKAQSEPDPKSRAELMRAAERILIEDMPILPLYYYVSRNLVQSRVKGWQDNSSNVHPSRTLRIAAQ
jgi:peptide/nickel transport system substrate-binding protein/oligopeptide transport system substrate-binding protein